jgi:hypothetical protein
MKKSLIVLALLAGAANAQLNPQNPVTLSCIREIDVDAGVVQINTTTNTVTIQGNSWTVTPDGSGIITSGSLTVAGRYLRMNRFTGVVMARWNDATPPGSLDFVGVCNVKPRLF